MKTDDRKYVRVYYSVINDERFAEIFHDARRLGTWLQMLLVADAMFPADAPVPAYVHKASLKALTDCGLVEIRAHQHFRLHGLASERDMRSQSARIANRVRWDSERNPKGILDKTSIDKTSKRAPAREGPKDPLREAQRAAYVELYGNGSEAPFFDKPTTVPTPAEQEREALRLEALALHERYLAGELGPAEYERLLADLGKQPDDLTRARS